MTQRSPQRLHHHQLTLSAKYHYAQVLADEIQADRWTQPSKRVDYGDEPSFQIRGAGMIPTPGLIEARTTGHDRAGIPSAIIKLGRDAYLDTVLDLPDPQFEAWMIWLRPLRDKLGRRVTAPALFRPYGSTFGRAEHTSTPEQDAALAILRAAVIDTPPTNTYGGPT